LSKMLKRAGVPHSVLNAKQHQKEAEIITNAGQSKTVTISTNMAGRGTDIVLGDGVREAGGLHILGTERHESRRVDNQLRGRAGRQGDLGSSRFYLSLEDDLLRIFGSDRISSIMERFGMEEGEPIEHKLISRGIENAQKKVEGHNFNIRKNLLEYDDVMNRHREIVYSLRKDILFGQGIGEIVREMIDDKIDAVLELTIKPKDDPEDWDLDELRERLFRLFGFRAKVGPKDMGEDAFAQLKVEELADLVKKQVQGAYWEKEKLFGKEELEHVEKFIMLQIIDDKWIAHLQSMDHMKEGIGLRGYGQLDPLKEYQKEGFALFGDFLDQVREESLGHIFRLRIVRHEPEEKMKPKKKNLNLSHGDDSAGPTTVRRKEKKVGRNAPCPCGSGKKYKKCCGMNG
jgi:preprotein translocase subunit SecA